MNFEVFQNIMTASDPDGGRALKVTLQTGVDDAESYYTKSDPAGGRAIKVKLLDNPVNTGVLQMAGGVALSSTLTNVTDQLNNASTLYLSTNQVKIGTTANDNPLALFGLSGLSAIFNTSNIATSNKTFTFPNASLTFAGIDIAQNFTADNTFSGANTFTAAQTFNNQVSAQSLRLTGTAGAGHLHLLFQSADPTIASATTTVLYGDNAGNLRLKNGASNFTTTFSTSGNGQNSIYTFPNVASTTLAGLSVAQTFTANSILSTSAETYNGLWFGGVASITAISGNGTTVTYTSVNIFKAGDIVTITGSNISGYNLVAATIATATATQFTITNSATGTNTNSCTATIVGATATTVKPFFLIEPSGVTSTAWNTRGTGLGINASSSFTGDLFNCQLNGAVKIKLTYSGDFTIYANPSRPFQIGNEGYLSMTAVSIGDGAYDRSLVFGPNGGIWMKNYGVNIGGTATTKTALLTLGAGTAAANTAPLKFTAGTNLTTPENGTFEFDGSFLYFTIGGVRLKVTLTP
jgi:hypothetical protein